MDSINSLDKQIQVNQQKLEEYNRRADMERATAVQYAGAEDNANAQVFFATAQRHDDKASELEASIQALTDQKQQAEARLAELEQERIQTIQEHDQKLNGISSEIEHLRHG